LLFGSNPNDNSIYAEAFNSTFTDSANPIHITGAYSGSLPLTGIMPTHRISPAMSASGRVTRNISSPSKGPFGAEEFIVTNTGWSDYVFQPGYRLRPLSEVGAYIQANHHPPDIPSEVEVKEKGVSVGEMQSKLLAKVEELTLHMIQADERNNRLEEQNRELRDRIPRLEKGAASVTPTAAR
jgi:hypothetical protein